MAIDINSGISIPFLPHFAKKIIDGKKIITTRHNRDERWNLPRGCCLLAHSGEVAKNPVPFARLRILKVTQHANPFSYISNQTYLDDEGYASTEEAAHFMTKLGYSEVGVYAIIRFKLEEYDNTPASGLFGGA